MKKTGEFLAIISSILLIFSQVSVNFISNSKFTYLLNIISDLYFELIILFTIGVIIILIKKFKLKNVLNRYYTFYRISDNTTKYSIIIVLGILSIITSYNIYLTGRAKIYYYKKYLFSTVKTKANILYQAHLYESKNYFEDAVIYYKKYIDLSEQEKKNYFLKEKIKTLENRIRYANNFYELSQKEYNGRTKMYTQEGISLLYLSYKLYSENYNVKQKLLENIPILMNKIDTNLSEIDKGFINHENLLLGREITKELSTGDFGRPKSIDSTTLDILIKSIDTENLKKYITNSWKYYELKEIRDSILDKNSKSKISKNQKS